MNEIIGKPAKIAITGPESTGKSDLTDQLAGHYHSLRIPEYAREYLDNLGRPYIYSDILIIAREQYTRQQAAEKVAGRFLFCDTELIVTKIWCEFRYGKCHPWILDHLEKQDFELYLLMNIDLPWQDDPQREHPGKRKELFNLYLKELQDRNLPFHIISGTGEKRLHHAISIIEKHV